MSITIHGKEYITVAERIKLAHEACKQLSITTELLPIDGRVVVKATVTTEKGVFTGTSAADPTKPIEKASPYEVAESSAVGRALGFAGYGVIDSIASAEEMTKATTPATPPATDGPFWTPEASGHNQQVNREEDKATEKQVYTMKKLLGAKISMWEASKGLKVDELTKAQAIPLIDALKKREAEATEQEVDQVALAEFNDTLGIEE